MSTGLIPTPLAIWKVPYRRNPFFTGNEELLSRLRLALQQENAAALSQPQGISGLGGIGKTQLALEYAYRYHTDYQAVLWVGADSALTLTSEFVAIAHILRLPECNEQDQQVIVQAVLHWLQLHVGWLLILDNVESLAVVEPFFPKIGRGHILLTTRSSALGAVAWRVELEKMEPGIGATLLLRRACNLPVPISLGAISARDREYAMEISQMLDGLPLALDQAGAYIKETSCTIEGYRELYQKQHQRLLQVRGSFEENYPAPVTTTWALSFDSISRTNPSASDLLSFCSFLYPDAIPEELITAGAEHLPPQLQESVKNELRFNVAVASLLAYSLVRRSADERVLHMHRLVQVVLKDAMSERERQEWEDRTIRAVDEAFPLVEHQTWSQCERCLPHAQVCIGLIEREGVASPQAIHLLNQTGYYLHKRGRYREVEPLFERLRDILDQPDSADHNTAVSLNNLALLYYAQGEYEKAELLLQRALIIEEKASGPKHLAVANILNSLAGLCYTLGRFVQAEPLYLRALTIFEENLGTQHPDTIQSIHNLAVLQRAQGKLIDGELLLQQIVVNREKALGVEHPDTAASLLNLAEFYYEQGKLDEAEPLYRQALEINERELGLEHPDTAVSMSSLAKLYSARHEYEEAEGLYRRALALTETQLGSEHSNRALMLHNLAAHYQTQGRLAEAESLYQQALAIRRRILGHQHPDVAKNLYNLAVLYKKQNRLAEAEPLFKQALAIFEQQLGPDHPLSQRTRESYGRLPRHTSQKHRGMV